MSCEINSIGATGVKPQLLGRTIICIGAKKNQPAKSYFNIGSDYAGLPISSLWPYQIVTTMDGKFERKKWRNSWWTIVLTDEGRQGNLAP